ncbi:DUF6458 family protein [Aestuariimicrobium ganziense]|uniref:DUF6458 family protein n=1 Tax=Aestuariimicrobium ganziense TaxID=2773677 RepID=UPI001942A041|nr:DUF6458 family protein [Aestuariimicrobium ganziense]
MWIGLGIFLIVVGAILSFAVNVDIPFISDDVLGWILIIAGIAAIILSFLAQGQRQRARSEVVVDEVHREV